jgi:hypothetical protein
MLDLRYRLSMPKPSDQDYKARLGAVLRRRDPETLHLFLRQNASGFGDERQVVDVEERSHEEMEELMHRMILARTDMADLHAASRAWLAGRGPAVDRKRARSGRRPPYVRRGG